MFHKDQTLMNKLIILIQGQQDEREEVERSYFGADQQRGGHDCGPPDDQSREGRPHRLLQTVQIPGPDHLSQKGLLQAEKFSEQVWNLIHVLLNILNCYDSQIHEYEDEI